MPLTGPARYNSTALPLRRETWTFLSTSPIHRVPSEVGPSAFVCYCRTSIKLVDFIPEVKSKSKKSKKVWPGWYPDTFLCRVGVVFSWVYTSLFNSFLQPYYLSPEIIHTTICLKRHKYVRIAQKCLLYFRMRLFFEELLKTNTHLPHKQRISFYLTAFPAMAWRNLHSSANQMSTSNFICDQWRCP